jgi:hypothetical protein
VHSTVFDDRFRRVEDLRHSKNHTSINWKSERAQTLPKTRVMDAALPEHP